MKIPSFTSKSSSSAPTITLTGTTTSVTDTNGVLSGFSFTNGSGASFSKSGNTLNITQTGTISESKVFSATKYVPSASSSTYNIWYMSGSSYQTCINIASASSGSVNAYFKLKGAPTTGDLSLTKTTEDSKNLSGWQFGIYTNSACTTLAAGPYTTNTNGKISVTGLSAGTYYVKELGHTDSSINALYYCSSTNPQKVTISAGSTASVSFTNKLNTGGLSLTKTTEDRQNLQGWKFSIYSDAACSTLVSGPHTTNSSGKISVTGLKPGTYYVKELGHTDSSINALYSCASTNPQSVTITGGSTASVSFYNKLNTGSLKIIKSTNTGENLAGWKINLYTDAACTSLVSGSPFTTGADGTITVTGLKPGTYYAKEVGTSDSYWECDTEVKSAVVAVGQTASVTFQNTHYGCIRIQKTTNTGKDLGGWVFRVKDMDGNIIGDFTTDEEGAILLEKMLPGRYLIQELPIEDNYWTGELGFHDVIVKAGGIVTDTWLNKDQGLCWFYKKTNTGENLEGWEITVYRDEACTDKVGTLTTNEDGRCGYYLDPGTYYAKETGDTNGRFENEYWLVDETVYEFEIKPHEDTAIYFSNTQYGKIAIQKTMNGDGSLEGWQFKITNADGKEVEGSLFTTDAEGKILTANLLPGEYTVEELFPKDSLYYCESENPQTVTVKQGETAQLTFTNALHPGKISIEKVNLKGDPLSGATFLLEWSEDGSLWWPIEYSGSDVLEEGCCSNPDVKDGCLTSGADGMLVWDNLYPGLYYRVKEVKAPDGYNLLKKAAYEGKLTAEDFDITIRVINTRIFTLPETGSHTLLTMPVWGMIFLCMGMAVLYSRKRRV